MLGSSRQKTIFLTACSVANLVENKICEIGMADALAFSFQLGLAIPFRLEIAISAWH